MWANYTFRTLKRKIRMIMMMIDDDDDEENKSKADWRWHGRTLGGGTSCEGHHQEYNHHHHHHHHSYHHQHHRHCHHQSYKIIVTNIRIIAIFIILLTSISSPSHDNYNAMLWWRLIMYDDESMIMVVKMIFYQLERSPCFFWSTRTQTSDKNILRCLKWLT